MPRAKDEKPDWTATELAISYLTELDARSWADLATLARQHTAGALSFRAWYAATEAVLMRSRKGATPGWMADMI